MGNLRSFNLIFVLALISHFAWYTSRAFYIRPTDQDSSSVESGDEPFEDELSGSGIVEPDENCKRKIDMAFVLDSSDSIGPVGFAAIKGYTKQVVNRLKIHECDNVGLIKFTDFADSEIFFGSQDTKADIIERIDDLAGPKQYVKGEVNQSRVDLGLLAAEEILFTKELGLRESSEKILVLFTDGNTKQTSSNEEISNGNLVAKLEKKGIKVFVVVVGKHASIPELLKIAGDERNIFPADRVADLVANLLSKDPSPINKSEETFSNTNEKTKEGIVA